MENLIIIAIYSTFIVICTVALIFYLLVRKKLKRKQLYREYLPKSDTYSFKQLNIECEFGGQSWNKQMSSIAKQICDNGVTHIFLVHGTFVGNDPFNIIKLLKHVLPNINQGLFNKLEELTRNHQSKFIGDFGNFDQNYLKALERYFKGQLTIHEYNWSGANHHLARLEGAQKFLQFIYQKLDHATKNHFLFFGHSHAGQIFALITQLLQGENQNKIFFEIFKQLGIHPQELNTMINKIKKQKIDIVTMGTPPRYHFITNKKIRLLHIVNHRGESPFAGNLSGILFTKDGDYIQQLGIAGSDSLSPLKEDRKINERLDEILGPGMNISHWQESTKFKTRVHDSGHTFLIDYCDQSSIPNCLKTLFGHGIYTSRKCMLYNFSLIKDYFYSS